MTGQMGPGTCCIAGRYVMDNLYDSVIWLCFCPSHSVTSADARVSSETSIYNTGLEARVAQPIRSRVLTAKNEANLVLSINRFGVFFESQVFPEKTLSIYSIIGCIVHAYVEAGSRTSC